MVFPEYGNKIAQWPGVKISPDIVDHFETPSQNLWGPKYQINWYLLAPEIIQILMGLETTMKSFCEMCGWRQDQIKNSLASF